ncbi:MAG: hypothetical protein JNJ55_10525 [Betaproteobacteria bacterium]|nr:hypothetical protein [Betaproteobacteria bacterium]
MRAVSTCLLIAALFAVHAPITAHADQERAPRQRVFASTEGHVAFAMLPPPYDEKTGLYKPGGRGIAYALQKDGSFKVLYRTEGWYATEVFLSPDGKYLVRLGPWSRGRAPAKDHLAIAFYRDGKLLKQYSTLEMLKDPTKARASVSHYFWRPDEAGDGPKPELADWDLSFSLQTVDGWEYVFDLKTGGIKREDRVEVTK